MGKWPDYLGSQIDDNEDLCNPLILLEKKTVVHLTVWGYD
jgi:hypothetical protein